MSETLTAVRLCQYELGDTVTCGSEKVFARGYCEKHYRALSRAGAFTPVVNRRNHASTVKRNTASYRKAQKKLERLAPTFVDHLAIASEISAMDGKSETARWALLHTRIVDPIESTNTANVNHQPVINIGVKVSGVTDTAQK